MKQKLPNLFQLIKIADQKKFLIKITLVSFVTLVVLVALYFELQFRRTIVLEGFIRSCQYQGYDISCSYLESPTRNFLLTQGTIDKVRQIQPTISLEGKKVRITGFLSRQKLAVENLGKINRFQIETLDFLD